MPRNTYQTNGSHCSFALGVLFGRQHRVFCILAAIPSCHHETRSSQLPNHLGETFARIPRSFHQVPTTNVFGLGRRGLGDLGRQVLLYAEGVQEHRHHEEVRDEAHYVLACITQEINRP